MPQQSFSYSIFFTDGHHEYPDSYASSRQSTRAEVSFMSRSVACLPACAIIDIVILGLPDLPAGTRCKPEQNFSCVHTKNYRTVTGELHVICDG